MPRGIRVKLLNMKASTLIWVLTPLSLVLLIGIPVIRFVFVNLKAGYDQAQREAATRPTTAPAPAESYDDPKKLASIDFHKLDFSANTIDVSDHADHYLPKLPAQKGTSRYGYRDGMVGQGKFEVRGGVAEINGATSMRIPSSAHSGGLATLEVAVEKGKVRAYLGGLNGHIVSGYVFVEVSPGSPGRLTGYMEDWSDTGTPEQQFTLESLDGDAQGVSFRLYRK